MFADIFTFSFEELVQYGGLLIVLVILFIETGLLIGLLFPVSDAILFAAGLMCGTRFLDIPMTLFLILAVFAAFIGDLTGYSIGARMGKKFFRKKDNFFFKYHYLQRAKKLYRTHGNKAIILGRFIPIVRTINPVSCGALSIHFTQFFIRTGIACILHISSIFLISYFLGKKIPGIKNIVTLIIPFMLLIIVAPMIYKYMMHRKNKQEDV